MEKETTKTKIKEQIEHTKNKRNYKTVALFEFSRF